MACRVSPFAALSALLPVLPLAGCSTIEQSPHRAAWREQAEKACIASHRVHLGRFVAMRERAVEGAGECGLTQPFLVGALDGDKVQLDTVATLDCSMVAALDEWVEKSVEPIAQARFGQPVVGMMPMASYSCRGMNGQAGAQISEHAFGNALDVGGFRLADGRRLTVVHDWTHGDEQAQAFLRDVQAGACEAFTTVLAPGSNPFHYNHIHVDLAMHGRTSTGTRRICKPLPEASRPAPRQDGPRLDDLPDPIVNGRIDLGSLAAEILVVGLDPHPRKPGVAFADPAPDAGEAPDASPFAALRALKGPDGA